MAPLHF